MKSLLKKKLVLATCVVFLSLFSVLVLSELVLQIIKPDVFPEKLSVGDELHRADCYSSNPDGRFPLSLREASLANDFKILHQITDSRLEELKARTPHCLKYDVRKREAKFDSNRPADVYLVGDSFTFGIGVGEKDTLGFLLEKAYPQFHFVNLGHPGADFADVFFKTMFALSSPQTSSPVKHIIYIYNLNDLHPVDAVINDFEEVRWKNRENNLLSEILNMFYLGKYLDRTLLMSKVSKTTTQTYLDYYFAEKYGADRKKLFDTIKGLDDLVKENGAQFHLVIYPLLYKKWNGEYPFLPIHQLILDFCQKKGLSCVDGYPAFEKERSLVRYTVHPADFHPNEEANRVFVMELAKRLKLTL